MSTFTETKSLPSVRPERGLNYAFYPTYVHGQCGLCLDTHPLTNKCPTCNYWICDVCLDTLDEQYNGNWNCPNCRQETQSSEWEKTQMGVRMIVHCHQGKAWVTRQSKTTGRPIRMWCLHGIKPDIQ